MYVMSRVVDFKTVSTVGLEASPVAAALARRQGRRNRKDGATLWKDEGGQGGSDGWRALRNSVRGASAGEWEHDSGARGERRRRCCAASFFHRIGPPQRGRCRGQRERLEPRA